MPYYYLITSLRRPLLDAPIASLAARLRGELSGDGGVPAVRDAIKASLSRRDGEAVELLYRYYDVVNILNRIKGSGLPFSPLGNLSRDRVEGRVVALRTEIQNDEDGVQVEAEAVEGGGVDRLENRLLGEFYRACEGGGRKYFGSPPEYLRRWARADRMIRNLTAWHRGRAMGWDFDRVRRMLIDFDPKVDPKMDPGAVGYALRLPYMDELVGVWQTTDFVAREQKMDALRWHVAEELRRALRDYFGIGTVLCYLIQLNLLYRWSSLDPEYGKGTFRQLVDGLTRMPTEEKTA